MRNIITIVTYLCFSVTGICQVAGENKNGAAQTETTNTLVQDDTESPDTENGTAENANTENADTVAQQTGNTQDEMTEQNTTGYVGTRTNSSSGSPAIPASEGEEDGTNTKQSASLNIAGAKIPGGSKTVDKNKGVVTARETENKKDEKKDSRSEKKKRRKK
ncbi:MAG TPA: hypothetical protein VD884_18535 [Ohtaekwangia sp.]|nr:hypothetical protein [Ohtaekwangia sp.]